MKQVPSLGFAESGKSEENWHNGGGEGEAETCLGNLGPHAHVAKRDVNLTCISGNNNNKPNRTHTHTNTNTSCTKLTSREGKAVVNTTNAT